MILSEEQAKTKRCQESFGRSTSQWETVPAHLHCIGSGCMAWRWYDGEPAADEPSCRGYCGKAGRPSP